MLAVKGPRDICAAEALQLDLEVYADDPEIDALIDRFMSRLPAGGNR